VGGIERRSAVGSPERIYEGAHGMTLKERKGKGLFRKEQGPLRKKKRKQKESQGKDIFQGFRERKGKKKN